MHSALLNVVREEGRRRGLNERARTPSPGDHPEKSAKSSKIRTVKRKNVRLACENRSEKESHPGGASNYKRLSSLSILKSVSLLGLIEALDPGDSWALSSAEIS